MQSTHSANLKTGAAAVVSCELSHPHPQPHTGDPINLDHITITNDIAIYYLITAISADNPAVGAAFSAALGTVAIESAHNFPGQLGNDVRDRLISLAAAAAQPTRQGAPLQ